MSVCMFAGLKLSEIFAIYPITCSSLLNAAFCEAGFFCQSCVFEWSSRKVLKARISIGLALLERHKNLKSYDSLSPESRT